MLSVEVITETVNASWKVKSQTARVSCQGECRNGRCHLLFKPENSSKFCCRNLRADTRHKHPMSLSLFPSQGSSHALFIISHICYKVSSQMCVFTVQKKIFKSKTFTGSLFTLCVIFNTSNTQCSLGLSMLGAFSFKKTKQKQKRNFSSLELLMMDENIGKCLELLSRSLFQQAIHPQFVIANTSCFCCCPCMDSFGYRMTCFVPGCSVLLQGGKDSS